MSSQVQWLLLLHCADKVARCVVLGFVFFLLILRHTHTLVWYMFGNKKSKNIWFLKLCHVFILLLVSYSFGDEGQGYLLFKNPCVFFSKKCM